MDYAWAGQSIVDRVHLQIREMVMESPPLQGRLECQFWIRRWHPGVLAPCGKPPGKFHSKSLIPGGEYLCSDFGYLDSSPYSLCPFGSESHGLCHN